MSLVIFRGKVESCIQQGKVNIKVLSRLYWLSVGQINKKFEKIKFELINLVSFKHSKCWLQNYNFYFLNPNLSNILNRV